MSDVETEQFYLVIEDPPKKRSSPWVKMIAGFIVCITLLRLLPFVTWHSVEGPDGQRMSVMNVWSQSFSYVHGNPPDWQRETHGDGTVVEGSLKNGKKDARWIRKSNGGVIESIEYWDGEVIPKASHVRKQQ